MKKLLRQSWKIPPHWLKILIISILLLGVFFRFANSDSRIYWHDETYTLLRVSGYSIHEVTHQSFDGRVIGVEELQKYQQLNSKKNFVDTVNGLAIEEPQHPPLFYLIARYWVQWMGNSVAAIRSLPALISLLAFPSIYWLCWELFRSNLIGWIAMGLVAVSPYHVHYAQEIREYSLWTVTILLMSASLLWAIRRETKLAWGVYAATIVLAFYSFVFSGFVVIGHGIYIAATEGFQLSKKVIGFLIASLIGIIVSFPWLLVVAINLPQVQKTNAWMNEFLPLKSLVHNWIFNLQTVFLKEYHLPHILKMLLAISVTMAVGYSIYFVCRNTPKRIWLFIICLILPISLGLVLPDLFLGGVRSTISRYLAPCYLGIQLAVAFTIAAQFSFDILNFRQHKLWKFMTTVLIIGGVFSCAMQSVNMGADGTKQVAAIINSSTQPLVISSEVSYQGGGNIGDVMGLSHLVQPNVKFQLVVEPNLPKIPLATKIFSFINQHNISLKKLRINTN
jgi:uncharacterized membrane protein